MSEAGRTGGPDTVDGTAHVTPTAAHGRAVVV